MTKRKVWAVVAALFALSVGGALFADVAGHCWWFMFCTGDCVCTGDKVELGEGRCEFWCYRGGDPSGHCSTETFPFHCSYSPI